MLGPTAQSRLTEPRTATCSPAGPQLQTLRRATPAEFHYSTQPTSVPPTPSSQVADALALESVVLQPADPHSPHL